MIRQFKDILKFILVFSFLTAIFIPSYLYFFPSDTEKDINNFYVEKIDSICTNEELKTYQECLRPTIAKFLINSRPLDLSLVLNKIEEIYYHDLQTTNNHLKIAIIKLHYIENIALFIDYFRSFSIERNKITFFDIIFIPYVQNDIRKSLIHKKEEILIFNFKNLPGTFSYRKELALKKIVELK